MKVHHDKHHQAYVDKANGALEGTEWEDQDPKEILKSLDDLPDDKRTAVRNNLGGHVNHAMFWRSMKADGGGEPSGDLADAIDDAFGSFDDFKEKMKETGVGQFGSGWAWLVHDGSGLAIVGTPNQDNPVSDGQTPLLGVDVWEHAYYLKYQNKRPDYIEAWFETVDWDHIGERYAEAERLAATRSSWISGAGASSMVTPVRGSRGEARDSRSATADQSPATSAAISLGTKPRCRPSSVSTAMAFGSCGLSGSGRSSEPCAPAPRPRTGAPPRGSGRRPRPPPGCRARPAPARRGPGRRPLVGIDRRVARQPHDASVVGVPVALLEGDADLHRAGYRLVEAGQAVVGDVLPGRRVGHVLPRLGPDARVAVERAEAHQGDVAAGPAAEQVRAALAAEHLLHPALRGPSAQLVLAAEDGQRVARNHRGGRGGAAGADLAAGAVAVGGGGQRLGDLELHGSAATASGQRSGHGTQPTPV